METGQKISRDESESESFLRDRNLNLMLATRGGQETLEKNITSPLESAVWTFLTHLRAIYICWDTRHQVKVHPQTPSWGNSEFNLRVRA